MKKERNFFLIPVKATFLSIVYGFLLFDCGNNIKKTMDIGVSVMEEKRSGENFYRIISVGKASEIAIQKSSYAMMQSSACETAKLMARRKIQELTLNPTAKERLAESLGFRIFEGGMYCEGTYLLPK